MIKKLALVLSCLILAVRAQIPPSFQKRIKELVLSNPGQLSYQEYATIAHTILTRAPCNVLIFGVGYDSDLWMACNKAGLTVFVENNELWMEIVRSRVPSIYVHKVIYDSKMANWKQMLNKTQRSSLLLELPEEVKQKKWDVIFVDAPVGTFLSSPGRMKSIYTASVLASKHAHVDVFVHDCNRDVENIYSRVFLCDSNFRKQIEKLRHYHIPHKHALKKPSKN